MSVRPLALAALLVCVPALAQSALAQIQTLPETSRSEGAASAINRSLATQSQNRTVQQQNQFEINSLRNTPAVTVPATPVVPVAPAPVVPMR